jgi:prepilin-type N-terminal cleavage/methylation domain-containing protein
MMRRQFHRDASRRRGDDRGFTLVELLVAMGIFSIVLAIAFSAIAEMTRNVRKAQGLADATDVSRRIFLRMDKQVRYASAVNSATLVGSDWYLEYQTALASGTTCSQWRLVDATDQLQVRSWTPSGTAAITVPAWTTIASGVVNRPTVAAEKPFTMVPADGTWSKQRLTVITRVRAGGQPSSTVSSETTFVAVNSSGGSVTNVDSNADGASDQQICQEVPRS